MDPTGSRNIVDVAADLGLSPTDVRLHGDDMAKVDPAVLSRPRPRNGRGRLILVSALTPTSVGEGKTTTTIGLAQALRSLGHRTCIALREPSLGPCLGMKGGGTGGGKSHLVPSDRINLHFTGDLHAVTAAHNLLAALLDNHLASGNALDIDPRRVIWRRVLDMNDRSLRSVIVGLGGTVNGTPRETGFDITAASEVMAALCLADDAEDLRQRLDRMLIGYTYGGGPVRADGLNGSGAMLVLLRDALWPNLVQSVDGTPALVHGGPFANIAHGCNSVVATRTALHLADWVVTEAGFGCDLGVEKFFDIKATSAGLDAALIVIVATVRALRLHGGAPAKDLDRPDPDSVRAGLPNLEKHIENAGAFGKPCVVAINHHERDTDEEIAIVRARCDELSIPVAVSRHFAEGAPGAVGLAHTVLEAATGTERPFQPIYRWDQPVRDKILAVAQTMYGAKDVVYTKTAEHDLRALEKNGYAGLPICVAKTQSSLSDDPGVRGRPTGFSITVRAIQVCAGAGFLVVMTGEIMRMPGLPKRPLAESLDLRDGEIIGLG